MKASMYLALMALTTTISMSANAIPPIPPSTVNVGPTVIKCADYNSLDSDELAELEENRDAIISLDQETREICFKTH